MSKTFTYTHKDGSITQARTLWFCEKAVDEALVFDDNTKLLIAIEMGLTELVSDEYCRLALAQYIKGEHRQAGNRPKQRQRNAQRDQEIWKRLHYWKGKGYPIVNEAGETDAASIVAEEMNTSRDTVRKVFRSWGGNDPEGVALAVAKFFLTSSGNE